jgi:hypothetical protein
VDLSVASRLARTFRALLIGTSHVHCFACYERPYRTKEADTSVMWHICYAAIAYL